MMRLWLNSYARRALALAVISGAVSIFVHAGVIAAWIYATLPDAGVPLESIANHVYFIPPPDRAPGQRAVRETVHYIDLSRLGQGTGDGPRMAGEARPLTVDESIGRANADSVTTPSAPPLPEPKDSVFSILDVDTAVVRSSTSAAPAYPLKLLAAHVMGSVAAQYVVDITGFADTSSFKVIRSTNPEFVTAVREALPYMRFRPAKIGPLRVRQLVEQLFTFRINDTTAGVSRKP